MRYPRYIESKLKTALKDTPVVLLHGPRQSGKTTLVKAVGGKKYTYVTFDDEAELASALHDPKGYTENLPRFCILDEIQRVPELFPSLKLAVDKSRVSGRFLLTGSANILSIPRLSESLAGRMEVINLYPLSQTEIEDSKCRFLKQAFAGAVKGSFKHNLGDQLFERVVAGGFPEPLGRLSSSRRRTWYTNYLNVLIKKDIVDFASIHYGQDIPLLLQRLANNTAGLMNILELNSGFSFDVKTTKSYVNMLTQLFLVNTIAPWFSNRNKRLIKTPKIHITDSGLLCALLKFGKAQLLKNRTTMGPILESFIYSELLKQASWHNQDLQFFHYRDKDQYEVDIVIENDEGELIGIEVKLASSANPADFKGLRRLMTQCPAQFKGGYLLYDGERVLPFGDRLKAVPISCLWCE